MVRGKDDKIKFGVTEWAAIAGLAVILVGGGIRFGAVETKLEALTEQVKALQDSLYAHPQKSAAKDDR